MYWKKIAQEKPGAFALLLVGVLILGAGTGCRSASAPDGGLHLNPLSVDTPPLKLTLEAGDEVDIKFYYTPELNETQRVRPDGIITLQLVGEVQVMGKTPQEVREDLQKRFAPLLQNPEVAVIVRSMDNRKAYVSGEVNLPGLVEMPGRLTALEAIMHAGGFNPETAAMSNVLIIRHKNNQRYGCALNFDDALDGKEYLPFYLEPNDIVYVPQTTIVKVTQWIDQHINRIIPLGFTYTVQSGNATIGLTTYGRLR